MPLLRHPEMLHKRALIRAECQGVEAVGLSEGRYAACVMTRIVHVLQVFQRLRSFGFNVTVADPVKGVRAAAARKHTRTLS
jgi:hypothetical protein